MAGPQLELVPEGTGDSRVPPNDSAAEQSTLGGMLLSKDAAGDVLEIVKPHDFYLPKHEIIFRAINTLFSKGEPTDVIMVTEQLSREGNLQKVGGASYLHTLESSVPTAANASYYAGIVASKALLRRLVEVGTRITQMGFAAEGEPHDLVNSAQTEIFNIGRAAEANDAQFVHDTVGATIHELEEIQARGQTEPEIPTGFREVDEVTNGLHPGQLVLIAARPGLGKSTLALDFARSAAIKHKVPTVFFSLEMNAMEISQRLISAEASVYLSDIRKADLKGDAWRRITATQPKLIDTPLLIDDSPNLTLTEIRAKCRRLKQQHGIKLVIIDYLQLLTSGGKVESRQQEVSEFSRSLKLLAKELHVPVVALSQLNRNSEQGQGDKRPQLSQLRESGSLEQDADIVFLLHRERYQEQGENRNDAELIIAKHRNGPTKDIAVQFEGHYSRFSQVGQGL